MFFREGSPGGGRWRLETGRGPIARNLSIEVQFLGHLREFALRVSDKTNDVGVGMAAKRRSGEALRSAAALLPIPCAPPRGITAKWGRWSMPPTS